MQDASALEAPPDVRTTYSYRQGQNMAEHKNVTLHDVAERAGVSYQTVSRALNNSGFVSAKTRARIDEAVAALHYVPNLMARQLSSRESKLARNKPCKRKSKQSMKTMQTNKAF